MSDTSHVCSTSHENELNRTEITMLVRCWTLLVASSSLEIVI